jgi:serine/threonine protein kinase
MGVVYLARQASINRLVALKMIQADRIAASRMARFQREARAVARLRHPHIVEVYETGETAGQPYIALEYVAGGSLMHVFQGRQLSPIQAAQLIEPIAPAVHAVHLEGVIHRDLKPHNVLLTPAGTPKVADFGLARLLDDDPGITQSGDVVGTPSYMAPEQAAGRTREVGIASDTYALGAILYYLLTGNAPFKGPNRLATLEQVCTQPPIPPRQLRRECPRDLEAICLKCLEKEQHNRYSSASELADDLNCWLAGVPIQARPRPLWNRVFGVRVGMKFITGQSLTVGEMLIIGIGLGTCGLAALVHPLLMSFTYLSLLFGFAGYVARKRRRTPRPLILSSLLQDEDSDGK